MFDIQIIKKNNVKLVDSLLLHKELKVKSSHRDWIARRIDNYQFEEHVDYFRSKKSEIKTVGRPSKSYLITIDMAKELCMLENNDIGKATRAYFIRRDKELRQLDIVRLAGIKTRKTLTDVIKESGENERMHGKGYSNFTRLTYTLTNLIDKYNDRKDKDGFRDTLTPEELERVELAESLIRPLLKLNKQYTEIKESLIPLFKGVR